jgi:hypothetical protein
MMVRLKTLEGISKNKYAFCGKKIKYPYVEDKLCQCIMNAQKNGFAVSVECCNSKAAG